MVQVQTLDRQKTELFGHGYRFGLLHQGDDQIVCHALLVVAEEGVPTGGEVRLFHQLGQVFDGGGAEGQEVGYAGQILAEPAAEREGSRFSMEEAPALASSGVVAFVELLCDRNLSLVSALLQMLRLLVTSSKKPSSAVTSTSLWLSDAETACRGSTSAEFIPSFPY